MRHRQSWSGLILLGLAVSWASACSNQGEGQRCDKNSGDSDCASGLVCTTIQSQVTTSTGGGPTGSLPEAVCCPPQNQSATTAVCSSVSTPFDAGQSTGGSTGHDAGPGGAAGSAGMGGGAEGGMRADAASGGASEVDAGHKDAQ